MSILEIFDKNWKMWYVNKQLSYLTFVILFSTCCHLVFAVLALSLDFLFGLRIWLIRLCAFLSNETSSDFRFRANSFILFSDSKDLILDSFLRVCFFKVDISRFRCVSISRWRLSVSFIFWTNFTLFLFMSKTSDLSFSTCLSYWAWFLSSLECSFWAVFNFLTSLWSLPRKK